MASASTSVASAKALAADRAAGPDLPPDRGGVLVSLGGDVAVAGPPPVGGWPIGIARESSTPAERVDQVVAILQGRPGQLRPVGADLEGRRTATVHHIIDPRTGDSVEPYWTLVSATGASCVEANVATTAAIVWGERGTRSTRAGFGQSVRLVRFDGKIVCLQRVADGKESAQ